MNDIIKKHYIKNWGSDFIVHNCNNGKIASVNKNFEILIFPPTEKRNMWTYATCGMSITSNKKLELHFFSEIENKSIIDILVATAYFHLTETYLDIGHSVNFGIPLVENSICTYGVLSLPYLDGISLEYEHNLNTRFLWLIPMTYQEIVYKKQYGLESLEMILEENEFNYLDFNRKSYV